MEWATFKTVLRDRCIAEAMGIRHTLLRETLAVEAKLMKEEVKPVEGRGTMETVLQAKEQVAFLVERLRCHDYRNDMIKTNAT
ncbi:hypothetical protein NDU88_011096 [Pleurodeles waltl]|uniref:Uncharacterized protein n=1 Tax=Pleurodeles waltl TaxID=8319 RepID=A0AAV7QW90_PLEWA|nr:hypothetical protein NDU88_011096 [Pleurodeles waltl]